MKTLELSRGMHTTISDCDFERVKDTKWSVEVKPGRMYARGKIDGKRQYLHRFLMGTKDGFVTDHIDGNGLNNIRENLRVCTQSQNSCNSRGKTKKHKKGVYKHSINKSWVAELFYKGNRIHIGSYSTEIDAFEARCKKAMEIHGDFYKAG